MKRIIDRIPGVAAMAAALVIAFIAAPDARAQLPNPSAAALGQGDNHTATARGFGALAWNPAGLGMPGNPGGSYALFPLRGVAAIGPVSLADLDAFAGGEVPAPVRQEWLDRIAARGGEEGFSGAELTYLSLQMGRVAFQASSAVHAVTSLGPGAAELILFGNAGRSGDPGDVTVGPSFIDVAATSTVALGYGHPIPISAGRSIAIGGTLKYTMGHAMLTGTDRGSTLDADPLELRVHFPVIHTDTTLDASALNSGSGIGLDLGTAFRDGPLSVGVTLRNLFHTFAWDAQKLLYRPGEALFASGDDGATDFDARPFAEAPAAVRDRVDRMRFAPLLAAGVGYDVTDALVLSADIRQRIGKRSAFGTGTHVGVGAEFDPLGFLPVRAGAAAVSGGFLFSGGVGLRLGPVHLTAAAVQHRGESGDGAAGMFAFSAGGR